MLFNHTIAIFEKIIKDIKKLCSITDIIVQLFFIVLYSFSIYNNIYYLPRLIVFSALLALSLIYFIFHIITLKNEEKHFNDEIKKKIRTIFTYIKIFVQAFSIGITLYEIYHNGASDLTIILSALTIIGFVIQILLEIIKVVLNYYISLLLIAVDKDTKPIQNTIKVVGDISTTLKNPKALLMGALNVPLGFVANKVDKANINEEIAVTEQPKLTKKQYKLHKKVKDLGLERIQLKNKLKEQKIQEKEQSKQNVINHQVSKLKSNLKRIVNSFKKDKPKE